MTQSPAPFDNELDRLNARLAELEEADARWREVEERLRESELLHRTMLDQHVDGIALVARGKIVYGNPSIQKTTGYSGEELTELSPAEMVIPEQRQLVGERIQKRFESEIETAYEYIGVRKDGDTFPVEVRARSIQYHGEPAMLVFLRDLTERNQAEEAVRRSDDQLRSILEGIPDTVQIIDGDGCYRHVTSNDGEMVVPTGAVTGNTVYDVLPKKQADLFLATTRQTIATSEMQELEFQLEVNGNTRCYSSRVVYFGQDDHPCGLWVTRDVTEWINARLKLRADEQLLRQLLDVQERERQLVSNDIHDGVVQYIVGAKMMLEAAVGQMTEKCEDHEAGLALLAEMKKVEHLMSQAIEEGRGMISRLRPLIIDEQGIVAAIEYLINEQQNASTQLDFSVSIDDERFEPMIEVSIFRIVQEALSNIRKHADCRRAKVALRQSDGKIRIDVRDNGNGFDSANAVPANHFGVHGIVERARVLGGLATINSRPGQGTHISVELPALKPPV